MVGSIDKSTTQNIAPQMAINPIIETDTSVQIRRTGDSISLERLMELRERKIITTLISVAHILLPIISHNSRTDYKSITDFLSKGDDAIQLKFDFLTFPYISFLSEMYFTKSYKDLEAQERMILKTHYPFDSPLPKENFKTSVDYYVHAFLFNNGVFQLETKRPDDPLIDWEQCARRNYDQTQKTIRSLNQNTQTLQLADSFPGAFLPPEISQLKELQSLKLNHYGNLTPEIAQLKKLETLEIYDYHTEHLCPQIGELTNLKTLTIQMKHLKSLPDSLLKIPTLTQLTIIFNAELIQDPVAAALIAKGCQVSFLDD